jgi:hypothetical protein
MYVLIETLAFLTAASIAAGYLLQSDKDSSQNAPFERLAPDAVQARSAHDRVTRKQRGQVNAGQVLAKQGIDSNHSQHLASAQLDRVTQYPHLRAATGEQNYHRTRDPHRRQQALAKIANGSPSQYWRVALANT